MRWLPRLIIKFGALSLLSLGACGNTGAPTYSAARLEPDSTDEPPFENGLPDLVKAVDNGRAVAVTGNSWWWFARREDCQRDINFPPIHGFSVQPPLPKDSVPWPRDPRRANQPSE